MENTAAIIPEHGHADSQYVIRTRNRLSNTAAILTCFSLVYLAISLWPTCYVMDTLSICMASLVIATCVIDFAVSESDGHAFIRFGYMVTLACSIVQISAMVARTIIISQCYTGWNACPCNRGSMVKSWAYVVMDLVFSVILISQFLKAYALGRDLKGTAKTHTK